jgi:hypothetical protein
MNDHGPEAGDATRAAGAARDPARERRERDAAVRRGRERATPRAVARLADPAFGALADNVRDDAVFRLDAAHAPHPTLRTRDGAAA